MVLLSGKKTDSTLTTIISKIQSLLWTTNHKILHLNCSPFLLLYRIELSIVFKYRLTTLRVILFCRARIVVWYWHHIFNHLLTKLFISLIKFHLVFASLYVSSLFLLGIDTVMHFEVVDNETYCVVIDLVLIGNIVWCHAMYYTVINHINSFSIFNEHIVLMWSLPNFTFLWYQLFARTILNKYCNCQWLPSYFPRNLFYHGRLQLVSTNLILFKNYNLLVSTDTKIIPKYNEIMV